MDEVYDAAAWLEMTPWEFIEFCGWLGVEPGDYAAWALAERDSPQPGGGDPNGLPPF